MFPERILIYDIDFPICFVQNKTYDSIKQSHLFGP